MADVTIRINRTRPVMKKMSCASSVTLISLRPLLKSLYSLHFCDKSCELFHGFSKGDPVKILCNVGAHKIAKKHQDNEEASKVVKTRMLTYIVSRPI